ncbi:MAG: hypothetical protein ACREQ5_08950 [Candidatus Dormibacteria bacterium]
MAHKLVHIKDVYVYVAFTTPEASADCTRALTALRTLGIKFNVLSYSDHTEGQQATLSALNTWTFGEDAHQINCSDFPILVWDECFDDFQVYRCLAHGLKDIKASAVFGKVGLVEKPD